MFKTFQNIKSLNFGFSFCCRVRKLVFLCFYARKQLCFQRVLAIAILSVRPSVTRVDQSKTEQARITKSSPSVARKTLVSGTAKLFHKFKEDHSERGR